MKRISEKKLEAFTVGIMGKRSLSKKELEDQKKKNDEEAAAHAFKEFVETFQDTPTPASKVWVKAGTYDAGSRREDNREKGKLYKPSSKIEDKSAADKAQEYAKMLASDLKKDSMPLKKKSQEKKKSNLELFKEELRQIQEEREERHKYKHIAGQTIAHQTPATVTATIAAATTTPNTPNPAASAGASACKEQIAGVTETRESGSFDTGDPNTTNLYLGNLNPKISEQQLMEIFGRYGPLASIKIMWPRSEEEKQRGRNCGFVAYMSRRDAERARLTLNGRYIMGYEMRLGWGKSVPIMNQPIFIPPTMLDLTIPPPASNLPFNAQPPECELQNVPKINYKYYTSNDDKENMERILPKCVVKIFIPTEKTVLHVIHRMIEFVIREGPMFEALIMSREMENPLFSFLFDNECPAHLYYRWKLFSLLQGDTPTEWNEKPFRMFKDGPIWQPPIANFFTQGMPDELVVDPDAPEIQKGALSLAQRERLEDLIHHLTPERARIGDAMIFCIEHGDAADEICECIADSLSIVTTLASRKIARLYLISDILHNCTVKVANASFFRNSIEKNLDDVFESLHAYYIAIDGRMKAEAFKSRVLKVLNTWLEWAVYPKELLDKLKCIFLGKQLEEIKMENVQVNVEEPASESVENAEEDIDGAPMSGDDKDDEDLDGVPLDGAALLKGALLRSMPDGMLKDTPRRKALEISPHLLDGDDIDGMPLDDDIDGTPVVMESKGGNKNSGGAFIPSKWETVDPEQVEAQAITTSKWDTLDPPDPPKFYDSNSSESSNDNGDSNHGRLHSYNESREKLREIELKIMKYQDELESGDREIRPGSSIAQEVEQYRKKLLRKQMIRGLSTNSSHGSQSPDSLKRERKRKKSSSPGLHYISSNNNSSSRKHSKSPGPSSIAGAVANTTTTTSGSRSKLSKTARFESPQSRRSSSPLYGSSSRTSKRESSSGAVDIYDSLSPNRHRSGSDKQKHNKYKH